MRDDFREELYQTKPGEDVLHNWKFRLVHIACYDVLQNAEFKVCLQFSEAKWIQASLRHQSWQYGKHRKFRGSLTYSWLCNLEPVQSMRLIFKIKLERWGRDRGILVLWKKMSSNFPSLVIFRLSELKGTSPWEQTVKHIIIVSNYAAFPELWKWCAQKVWQLNCKEWDLDTLETSRRFGWTAYWGGACTTAAAPPAVWTARNCWGLLWNPTGVVLLALLGQQPGYSLVVKIWL